LAYAPMFSSDALGSLGGWTLPPR